MLDDNFGSRTTFIDHIRLLHMTSQVIRRDVDLPLRKTPVYLDHQLEDLHVERVPIERKITTNGVALYVDDSDEDSAYGGDDNKFCSCSHAGYDKETCYAHAPSKRTWEALDSHEHEPRVCENLVQSALQRLETRQ